jgi:hypothetical protein
LHIKRIVPAIVAVAALAVPTAALADYDTASSNTVCAGHGAFANVNGDFGFLGQRDKPGANGYATGLNNSALCGSRS